METLPGFCGAECLSNNRHKNRAIFLMLLLRSILLSVLLCILLGRGVI